jgi:hypothetical protein
MLRKTVALWVAAHIFFTAHPYLFISLFYYPYRVTIVLDIPDMDEDIYYSRGDSDEPVVKDEVRRDNTVKGKRSTAPVTAILCFWSPEDFETLPAVNEILYAPKPLSIEDGFVPFVFHPPNI